MRLSDLFKMAFRNLSRRKLRIILTLTGVLIGTTSIIVMLSIGLGLDQMIRGGIEEMGSVNTIEVSAGYDYSSSGNSKAKKIKDEDLETLRNMEYVDAVMPYLRVNGMTITAGKYSGYSTVYAVDPNDLEAFGYRLDKGRSLTSEDKFQILIGAGINDAFYDAKNYDPQNKVTMEQLINEGLKATFSQYANEGQKARPINLEVVGMLKKSSMDIDRSIYINLEYYQKYKERMDKKYIKNQNNGRKPDKGYESVKVLVKDIDQIEGVRKKIEEMGFSAYSLTQFLNEAKKQMAMVQAVLGGMGGISLLVAAIGITNTMIMSIYERTKEIGVMKVIGASLKDIKRIFLVEAAMIGLLGGALGILFSYLISTVINIVARGFMSEMGQSGSVSVIPLWLVGVAMLFSALVGVVSGYLPAKRAMKLSALEAIRTN